MKRSVRVVALSVFVMAWVWVAVSEAAPFFLLDQAGADAVSAQAGESLALLKEVKPQIKNDALVARIENSLNALIQACRGFSGTRVDITQTCNAIKADKAMLPLGREHLLLQQLDGLLAGIASRNAGGK